MVLERKSNAIETGTSSFRIIYSGEFIGWFYAGSGVQRGTN